MHDYVIIICVKNTLTIIRSEVHLASDLEAVKRDVNYWPEYEDIYVYEVVLGKPIYSTGPFGR